MRSRPRQRSSDRIVRIRRLVWWLNALVLVLAFGTGAFILGALSRLQANLPSARELADYRPRLATEIYSTDVQTNGQEKHTLLARLFRENREWASIDRMPVNLIRATVAIEDRPFFKHRGFDPKGILRAFLANLRAGEIRQGGSTITQQLVRAIWLSPERTMTRKIKEILLSLQVERNFTKDEILEMYLNQVCYGHGAYGVRTAAELYFDKNPEDLTLAECALLAGLPRWPAGYSPFNHPERAKHRRSQVLQAMVEMGYIEPAEAEEANDKPLIPKGREPREVGFAAFRAPHFTHMVVRRLCEQYGMETIYEGGLKIYTSLNYRLQRAAEEELSRHVESLRRGGYLARDLRGQGSLVCLDVKTGDVLAMVGGVGPFEKVQYNRCAPGPPYYGRQAGSAFKPYVWTAALEHGYGPNSVVSGEAISIRTSDGRYWSPRGGSGHYTLASALQHSINRVSVRLLLSVGAEKVASKAALMMGIPTSRLRAVPSLALGTSEVSPLEMAVGFSCFPNGGYRVTPRLVRRIADYQGQMVLEFPEQRSRVISPEVAKSMVDMMKRVISSGTGTRARIPAPCAGKTGTAQDARDVWFVGFTPTLCTAIWIGNDDHSPIRGGAYGGTFCAPVWANFMRRAIEILPPKEDFFGGKGVSAKVASERTRKSGRVVTICRDSGRLATPYCPDTYEKAFGQNENLPGRCTMHTGGSDRTEPSTTSTSSRSTTAEPTTTAGEGGRRVTVCADSGQLATDYCPNTVERSYGAGQGPSSRCTLHGAPGGSKPSEKKPEKAKPKPPESASSGNRTGTGGGERTKPQSEGASEPAPAEPSND